MREKNKKVREKLKEQIKKTQDELQWIVAQRLLSALTIPGLSEVVCKAFRSYPEHFVACVTATFYGYAAERNLRNIKACLLAEGMAVTLQSQ